MANNTLKQIQDLLVAQVANLSNALSNTTDPDKAKQLLLEMQEVTHRIDVSQNLLFAKTSKDLNDCLPAIVAANKELANSIHQVEQVATIIDDTTELLKVVDQALDLAKGLLAA
jgi:signal transduction histidine kinase